jgi:DNA-binding response OmpR family regulator
MAARILSVSYDLSLLRSRQWILEREGYVVTSAGSLKEAAGFCKTGSFHLVMIGHSIPDSDKQWMIAELRAVCSTPVLALLCPGENPVAGVDYNLDALAGPRELTETVKRILAKAQAA